MKILALFVTTLSMIFAQHPLPIPGLQLDNFSGLWYVVLEYNGYSSINITNEIDCITYNIETGSNGGTLNMIDYLNGNLINNATVNFSTNGNNATWDFHMAGVTLEWLAIDPISKSWGTLAYSALQYALILSRTPSLSNAITNAQIALLKGEGYSLNSTNTYVILNRKC